MPDPVTSPVATSTRRAAPALEGRTIGVLEARMTDTIATLFEREGAMVVRAPALAEAVVDATAEIKAWVETLLEDRYDIVVFLTGVGVTRLLDEIERLGHLEAVRAALGRTTVVARGPKPSAALGRRRIGVSVPGAAPWTTQACVDTLRSLPLAGKRVALIHFGERSNALAEAIQEGGAILDELCIYEWRLPDDLGPLDKLVGLTIDGRVDAVVFTSQVQVRHFLEVAARSEREAPLIEALNAWTVTASIGPTCSAALVARGITPRIEPARPKLGPLVERVVQYLAVEGNAR
jgi:uroporphyrinogen-III synthase